MTVLLVHPISPPITQRAKAAGPVFERLIDAAIASSPCCSPIALAAGRKDAALALVQGVSEYFTPDGKGDARRRRLILEPFLAKYVRDV